MRDLPVFRHLPLGDLDRLLSRCQRFEFEAGELLGEPSAPASHVLVILEGSASVRLARETGEESIVAVRRRGDWLGESAAVDRRPHLTRWRADEAGEGLWMPRQVLLELFAGAPDLGDLVRGLALRIRELEQRLLAATASKPSADASLPERIQDFLGPSRLASAARLAAHKAAGCDLPALLVGETGTGKELMARAIHGESSRRDGPFVPINCGALQESLLESELFGHARGSFTGATRDKPGLVEAAKRGTLFLDEVADMPGRVQVALLRFLESGEFRRVGETRIRASDARVIAATTAAPDGEAGAAPLRPDLRFRLDVCRVPLPPLRDRPEDVPDLVGMLVTRVAERQGQAPVSVDDAAMQSLQRAAWAGNVRELRNEVERWTAWWGGGSRIGPDELSSHLQEPIGRPGPLPYRDAVRAYKTRLVMRALESTRGNVSRAASSLGLHRSNLSRLMRDLGIRPGSEAAGGGSAAEGPGPRSDTHGALQ